MDTQPVTASPHNRPILPWSLFAGAMALAIWALWRAFGPASTGDPLGTSLAAFEKQNRLTVFSAQLSPVVASDDDGLFGMIKSRQIAVIPARVDYAVDLAEVSKERLHWDADTEELLVRLPPLHITRPNLDEARALYLREGVWISRSTQDKLTRENTAAAEKQARITASSPAMLDLARNAAKAAIAQNLAVPLRVAGYDDITVTVRFDGEKEAQ